MKSGIYEIRNTKNDKVYVGSSYNLPKRESEHFRLLRNNIHFNIHLQRSFNRHAEDSFEFNVILYCEEDSLIDLENEFLFESDYNIAKFADAPMKGRRHSKETKEKFRRRKRVRWSEERKREYSERLTEELSRPVHLYDLDGKYIATYANPQEASEVIGMGKQAVINCCNGYTKSCGGFQCSYEKVDNIGDYESKIILSDETRYKLGSHNRGRSPSGKWKEAIIQRNKDFVWTPEMKKAVSDRSSKGVLQYCLDTGELLNEYKNVGEACKATGLTPDQIRGQLYGKTKSVLYYKWEFK